MLLHSVGIRPVLVHGGGPQIDEQMERQGKSVERIDGLRVTDGETLDIVRMVLVGKINRELVSAFNVLEPVAVGVAGEDGRLLEASPDRSRNSASSARSARSAPDCSMPCSTTAWCRSSRPSAPTPSGQPYNVNADDAARAIAVAMRAEKLIYLTGAPGPARRPRRSGQPGPSPVHRRRPVAHRQCASVTGGMIPKLLACAEAVEGGVGQRAHDRRPRRACAYWSNCSPTRAIGTMICREARHDAAKATAPAADRRLAARAAGRQPGGSSRATGDWPGSPRPRRRSAATSTTSARSSSAATAAIRYVLPEATPPGQPAAMLDRLLAEWVERDRRRPMGWWC